MKIQKYLGTEKNNNNGTEHKLYSYETADLGEFKKRHQNRLRSFNSMHVETIDGMPLIFGLAGTGGFCIIVESAAELLQICKITEEIHNPNGTTMVGFDVTVEQAGRMFAFFKTRPAKEIYKSALI